MAGKPRKRHAVTQPLDKPYRLIPLTQGQNAIVDVEDFDWLSQWNWCAKWDQNTHCFYAARSAHNFGNPRYSQIKLTMHRVILDCSNKQQGDHRNNNPLDNRRENLRICINAQNGKNKKKGLSNTSGFKGVSKFGEKWKAMIGVNFKHIYLGLFPSRKSAARAYDVAALKYFGEFAHLNFPK